MLKNTFNMLPYCENIDTKGLWVEMAIVHSRPILDRIWEHDRLERQGARVIHDLELFPVARGCE